MLLTSPLLTGYVALAIALVLTPILLLGRRVRLRSRDTQDKVAVLGAQAEEAVNAIRAVQSLTLEEAISTRFEDAVEDCTRATALARIKMRSFLIALVIALAFGSVVTVLWIGGHDVLAGRMTGGALSSFVLYAVMVAVAVSARTWCRRADTALVAGHRAYSKNCCIHAVQSSAGCARAAAGYFQSARKSPSRAFPSLPHPAGQHAVEGIDLGIRPGEGGWHWSGRRGQGKPHYFNCCCAFMTPKQGRFASAVRTSARWTYTDGAA